MRRRKKEEMACTEAELRAMTAEMKEMHEATFPQLREALSDLGSALRRNESEASLRASRRRFLATSGGLIVGTIVLAGCGDDKGDTAEQPPPPGPGAEPPDPEKPATGGGQGGADAEGLMLNASLENLAVFAYGAALEAAPKGMFGKSVPDAVAGFATEAMKQHQEHAEAFNAALTAAGGQAYKDPTPALAPTVKQMFAKVNSVPKLAMLALTLENTAAATYTKQMGDFTSKEALAAIATIAPVERQHAAILMYVLGEYPVPDTFVKLTATKTSLGARTAKDLKAS